MVDGSCVIIWQFTLNTENLPIFFILINNLPIASFNYNSSNKTVTHCNGKEVDSTQTTRAASDVIGAQVGRENGNSSALEALLLSPITLSFTFNSVVNGAAYRCVYWNFSDP